MQPSTSVNFIYQVMKTFLISKLHACELRIENLINLSLIKKRLVSQVKVTQITSYDVNTEKVSNLRNRFYNSR